MGAPYVPATEQRVVEIYVRSLERSLDFYRRLGLAVLSRKAYVRIMVPDVDACWATALRMGARVISAIADRDYGLRYFIVADPDGFGIRFGSRIGGG